MESGDDKSNCSTLVDLTSAENETANGGIEFELGPRVMADNLDIDRNIEDDAGNPQIEEPRAAEVNIRGLGNVKKASINPLVINHGVIQYAKAQVEKLNLKEVCVRDRERKLRKKNLGNDVMVAIVEHKETVKINIEAQIRCQNLSHL